MIIDSHINIRSAASRMHEVMEPWPGIEPADWWREVLLSEVEPVFPEAGVGGAVVVEAESSLDHTDFLVRSARASSYPIKVVGWLPLDDPSATASALQRDGYDDVLAGVRFRMGTVTVDSADLLLPEISRSLDIVAEAGLALNLSSEPSETLGYVPRIARAHPNLRVVIDLLGFPSIAHGSMQPWTDEIAAAAAEPNVYVKIAAMYRVAGGRDEPRLWRPYISTAVEVFGADRMMMASDWPAVRNFGRTYLDAILAVQELVSVLTPNERQRVKSGTAREVFGFP